MTQTIEYILISFVLGFLIVVILFLISQQKVLELIEPEHRLMKPAQVWLQLIPLFGAVWQFIVVNRISSSIQKQLLSQENDTILGSVTDLSQRPVYKNGVAYCVLSVVSTCMGVIPYLSLFQSLVTVAAIVFWIIYWIDLEKYKRMLKLRVAGGTITN